jgi:hypothetical protein
MDTKNMMEPRVLFSLTGFSMVMKSTKVVIHMI